MKISESKRPVRYFAVVAEDEKLGKRLNLLANQYAPLAKDPSEYIKSEEGWITVITDKSYKESEIGEFFEIRDPRISQVSGANYAISKKATFLEKSTKEEAEATINGYLTSLESSESPEDQNVESKDEKETEEKPKRRPKSEKTSLLDELLEKYPAPTLDKTGFCIDEKDWSIFIRNIHKGKNFLIKGDSGLGKTELVYLLGKSFDLPVSKFDMGTMQDPVASMIGVHRLKDGKSVFDISSFIEDLKKPGLILLDELNRAPLNALNILLPLLDRTGELKMSMASSDFDTVVKKHPQCVVIGTANIGTNFVGTNPIDTALKERFAMKSLKYPNLDDEVKILQGRAGINKTEANFIVSIANKIRNKYREDSIGENLSVRLSIEVAELVKDGLQVKDAIQEVMENRMEEDYEEVADILQSA